MRIAVVTGATGVFGRWIVEGLLKADCKVLMIVRDAVKAETMISTFFSQYSDRVRFITCELSSYEDIKRIKAVVGNTPIDILINNAAITPQSQTFTQDGIDLQFAVNVLSYHWMIREFRENLLLANNKPARVVNVASFYAGGLELSDVEYKARKYTSDSSYRASKQADRMLASAWSKRFPSDQVIVNSCHPGIATSGVSLGLGYDLDRSERAAINGAITPLFLALHDSVKTNTGKYYSDCMEQLCGFSQDVASVNKLFGLVESYSIRGKC